MKGIRQTRRLLHSAVAPTGSNSRCTVVLGHRDRGFTQDLGAALATTRLHLVASRSDAAAAAACIIAEQPDVVLVEQALPGMPTAELLEQIRCRSPRTVVAVLADDPVVMGRLLDGGATSAFHSQFPPEELARELARMVARLQQPRAS
jgi:DNA-binding NarL/FixJ family response regulator